MKGSSREIYGKISLTVEDSIDFDPPRANLNTKEADSYGDLELAREAQVIQLFFVSLVCFSPALGTNQKCKPGSASQESMRPVSFSGTTNFR
jgi:hypothetical protein